MKSGSSKILTDIQLIKMGFSENLISSAMYIHRDDVLQSHSLLHSLHNLPDTFNVGLSVCGALISFDTHTQKERIKFTLDAGN